MGFFVFRETGAIGWIKVELNHKYEVSLLWTSNRGAPFQGNVVRAQPVRMRLAATCLYTSKQEWCACHRAEVIMRVLKKTGSMKLKISCLERKLLRVGALNVCMQRVGFPAQDISATSSSLLFPVDTLWLATSFSEKWLIGWQCCWAQFELPLSREEGAGDMRTCVQMISAILQLPGNPVTHCQRFEP